MSKKDFMAGYMAGARSLKKTAGEWKETSYGWTRDFSSYVTGDVNDIGDGEFMWAVGYVCGDNFQTFAEGVSNSADAAKANCEFHSRNGSVKKASITLDDFSGDEDGGYFYETYDEAIIEVGRDGGKWAWWYYDDADALDALIWSSSSEVYTDGFKSIDKCIEDLNEILRNVI